MSAPQLWTKNQRFARLIARDYFIPGSGPDDVEQEALIALWVAARSYDSEQSSFKHFASIVIKRHLYSCIKVANREKQAPLTQSLRTLVSEDGSVEEVLANLPHLHQVVDIAEEREALQCVIAAIGSRLNEFERECVLGIANGMSYLELGPPKKVDNALYRARRKLKEAVGER